MTSTLQQCGWPMRMGRRTGKWRALAAGLALFSCFASANAASPVLTGKRLLIPSSVQGSAVWASTFYTQRDGQELLRVMANDRGQSDTSHDGQCRRSLDNGQTWSQWSPYPDKFASPGWVDPANGRLLEMIHMNVGTPQSVMQYRVSNDGGRTFAVQEQVIQRGYTSANPAPGVEIGKNEMFVGAISCVPIRLENQLASPQRDGRVLAPVQITPLGPDGTLYHPGAAPDWYEAAVLVGTWTPDMKLDWQLSQPVVGDPARTTRGLIEPTLAEMPDGRILMVCRGANDGNTSLPGYKWYSVSADGGLSWSKASPWTYSDGSTLYSSSSCSQLFRHSSGRYYWIGNISPGNPSGSSPRFPLVIGEVDSASLLLQKDTLTVIDTLGDTDNGTLQLSNFLAYEDRLTHEIVIDCTRFMTSPTWQGDCYEYRVAVPLPEPSCVAMMGATLVGVLVYVCRSKRQTVSTDRGTT
jgi:hypothetical protein